MNYKDKPVACTISLSDSDEQSIAWDTLIERATSTEQLELGIALTFDRGLTTEIGDLVDIERQCCSFLEFVIERSDNEIRLIVSAHDAVGLHIIHDALGMTSA